MSVWIEPDYGGASSVRRWPTLAFAGVALLAVLLVSLVAFNRGALTDWREDIGPLRFFTALALLPAIGLPITPLFILAGATFGSRVGLIGSMLALGVNLTLCYAVAHWLRPHLVSVLRRFGYELPHFGERKGAVRFTLAMKLAPGLPAFVKTYGLGLAGVPFPVYLGLSLLITGLYAASLILLGESLFQHRGNRALWAVVIVAALAFGFLWFRRRSRRETRARR